MQPLAIAILAGQTPKSFECCFIDERLESIPYDVDADLIAMSVETYSARNAYQIAERFRARGVPVVLGGCHPTFLPEEAAMYADSVVVGDAEIIWPQVLQDFQQGALKSIYRQEELPSLDQSVVDRRLFEGKRYAPIIPIQFGRGCRYSCDFCSIHALYGSTMRQRSPQDVAEEIRELKTQGRKNFVFTDDNLFNNPEAAKELFHAIKPLKIHWSCQVSLDIAQDESLLKLMSESGCDVLVIGFESLDDQNLQQIRKAANRKQGDYSKAIQRIYDHHMMIYGTFVIGYDHDRLDSFDSILEFAVKSKFFLANFNPLTPTPGTTLYDRLERKGRLLYDRWWLSDEYRYGGALFEPKQLSARQLTEGCYRIRTAFNRYNVILRRALHRKANASSPRHLGVHLLANIISRREIHRKQNLRLGSESPLKPVQ